MRWWERAYIDQVALLAEEAATPRSRILEIAAPSIDPSSDDDGIVEDINFFVTFKNLCPKGQKPVDCTTVENLDGSTTTSCRCEKAGES